MALGLYVPLLKILFFLPIGFSLLTSSFFFFQMFQKGSGLAPNVSREIAKLRSSRMLKDMEKRWFQELDSFGKPHIDWTENDDAFNRLTIHELGGLFVIVGVSHALVLALHLYQTRREISRALWNLDSSPNCKTSQASISKSIIIHKLQCSFGRGSP